MEPIRNAGRARRLARVLVSDVAVYAGDQLRIGLEKDDLFERLGPEIERARIYYLACVDPSLPQRMRLFDFAIVDVLLHENRAARSRIW